MHVYIVVLKCFW